MKYPIAIVGEAWGAEEAKQRTAFVGSMSWQLNPMLEEAGISRHECLLTNVFNIRYDGKIEIFCGPKKTAIPGYGPLVKGYVQQEFIPELERLGEEINEANPNLIIPMGNAALWAFTGGGGIGKFRGTTSHSTHTAIGYKILPTYHPAAVIHQWSLRPTVILDLMKAKREAEYPEIRRPKREVHIPETVEDLYVFERSHMRTASILSVDIETSGRSITCIGIGIGGRAAIVIPFLDTRRERRCYWPTQEDERKAWEFIKAVLGNPKPPKLFQNGLYDIAFLWRGYGIKVMGAEHDTMLLHHALQPEALKGLGYLGSIYTSESAWKQMRGKSRTIKRDE